MKGFVQISSILCLVLATLSCDAPRTNPLDPDSPDNILSTISGTVQTVSIPRTPLQNVNVYWKNRSALIETNSEGFFEIEDIERTDGFLYFEKDGYSPDSTYIEWNGRKQIEVSSFLNANPIIEELFLSSTTINKYPDLQDYEINVRAIITDDENDIDSVFFENSELVVFRVLDFNVSSGSFEGNFPVDSLNLSSIDETVGKDFFIVVKDKNGKVFNSGSSNIKRIIKQEIEFESPSDNEPVAIPFMLEWKRFTPGFDFKFSLQIYTNVVGPDLIWEERNLSSDLIFYEVNDALTAGEYFWVIWCFDEFNNSTRSKPATFTIQ